MVVEELEKRIVHLQSLIDVHVNNNILEDAVLIRNNAGYDPYMKATWPLCSHCGGFGLGDYCPDCDS